MYPAANRIKYSIKGVSIGFDSLIIHFDNPEELFDADPLSFAVSELFFGLLHFAGILG
jgi:hypothetical protein